MQVRVKRNGVDIRAYREGSGALVIVLRRGLYHLTIECTDSEMLDLAALLAVAAGVSEKALGGSGRADPEPQGPPRAPSPKGGGL